MIETPAEPRTQGRGGFASGVDADTAASRLAAARSRGQRTGGGCRGAAAGGGRGGAIPWHLPDLDLAEEDRVLSLVKPPDGSPGLRIAAARVLAPQLRGRRRLSAAGDRGGRPQPRLPIRPACAAARALCAPPAGTRRPREHRLAAAALGNDPVVRPESAAAAEQDAAVELRRPRRPGGDAGRWGLAAAAAAAWAGCFCPAASGRAARGRLCRADGSLPGGAAGQGWVPPTNDSGDDLYARNVSDIGITPGLCLGLPAMAGVRSKQGAVHPTLDCDETPFRFGRSTQLCTESSAALLHWEQTDSRSIEQRLPTHLLRPR